MFKTYHLRPLPTANLKTHTAFPVFTRTIRPLRWYRAMKFGR